MFFSKVDGEKAELEKEVARGVTSSSGCLLIISRTFPIYS